MMTPVVTEQIVISRREPFASVSSGPIDQPDDKCADRRIWQKSRRSALLIRISPTMLLKDCVSVSSQNSSRDVVGTTALSAPQARRPTMSRGHRQHLIGRP
jgi:hypothetical protein